MNMQRGVYSLNRLQIQRPVEHFGGGRPSFVVRYHVLQALGVMRGDILALDPIR